MRWGLPILQFCWYRIDTQVDRSIDQLMPISIFHFPSCRFIFCITSSIAFRLHNINSPTFIPLRTERRESIHIDRNMHQNIIIFTSHQKYKPVNGLGRFKLDSYSPNTPAPLPSTPSPTCFVSAICISTWMPPSIYFTFVGRIKGRMSMKRRCG